MASNVSCRLTGFVLWLLLLDCGTALPARQYCWSEELTPDLCCGHDSDFDRCMFDQHYFTQFECCECNWAILDPYGLPLSSAPPLVFPMDNDWSQRHPAESKEQKEWEQLVYFAARTKEVKLSTGSVVRLHVFKGDMPDIHLYHLENEPSDVRTTRIVDVGANYGGVAVALAKHFDSARIVVLEPNPLLCRFLLWNIRSNALTHRIWPLCAALGDTELLFQPCKQPWVGAPVNSCMNLAMRTFEADNSLEAEESVIKAKQEGQVSPRSGWRTEAAATERNSFEETMPEVIEDRTEKRSEERKAVRRRPQKSLSKDLSKGTRWGEDFCSLDEQMRRERLMNDSTYVGFQLVKLKRSQVMQRHFAEVGDIFEAGKGSRSPKPKRLNKDMESLSLPSLQPRASASGSTFEGSKRGSAVEKSREEKKEKKKGLDASSTMAQVRDLKALLKAELPASMPATKGSKDLTNSKTASVRIAA